MVVRKDCKHFWYKGKRHYSIDSHQAKATTRIPTCAIGKRIAGSCREDCKWFEPKQ